MTLSDPVYLLFLAGVFFLYYLLRPGQPRRVLLLLASYFFYFELSHYYIAVLLLVTAIAFYGAKFLRASAASKRAFLFFCLLVAIIITPMLLFKYVAAVVSVSTRESFFIFAPPVGISFFTFAATGYLIDVYLEVIDPEASPLRFALFLAFFPVVSAGPIERGGHFLPQFDLSFRFNSERTLKALRLILIGLMMKVGLADVLSEPVNTVYQNPQGYLPLEQLCAVLVYPFALYADFAGYSLIAIGSALLFGLEVRPNFQQPFFSSTIPEFWRNWHISLSSWVRDYLFAPLRMEWRNLGKWGMCAALLVSFVILGIWHGAKWGFVLFGFMHGCYAVGSTLTLPWRDKKLKALKIPAWAVFTFRMIVTFILVAVAFVAFRADTLTQTFSIYRAIFSAQPFHDAVALVSAARHHSDLSAFTVVRQFSYVAWIIPFLLVCDGLTRRKFRFESLPPLAQIVGYNIALLMVLAQWLTHYGSQPFVYYKF